MNTNVFHDASGYVPRHVHGWRTDIGEIAFGLSVDGTDFVETGFMVCRPDNGEAGVTWKPQVFFGYASSQKGAFGAGTFQFASNWDSFWQDDTPLVAAINPTSVLGDNTSSWSLGRSNVSNAIGDAPLDIVWNHASEGAYIGRIIDIRMTPENVPGNETQDGDVDLVRRLTVGELWLPHRAAAGPLVL